MRLNPVPYEPEIPESEHIRIRVKPEGYLHGHLYSMRAPMEDKVLRTRHRLRRVPTKQSSRLPPNVRP